MIRPHRSIMLFAALLGALPAVHPSEVQAAREREDLLSRLRVLGITEESVRDLARQLGLGFEAAAAHAIEAVLRGESKVVLPPAPAPERVDWSGIAPKAARSPEQRSVQRDTRKAKAARKARRGW